MYPLSRDLRNHSALLACLALLTACPNQELAPLKPCTIAAASIDAAQNGVRTASTRSMCCS
jgi:hypothetical protein